MRKNLFGTVAFAALALAASGISQPVFSQPAPGRNPGAEPGQGRQQERPAVERPSGEERSQDRAQDRGQERAQERGLGRQQERSAQPARPDEARPDTPRPPRAAEPATPQTPPDRRNAEGERANPPARANDNRPDAPRNPRAAEPATPAQPARPDGFGNGRIEPARPRTVEPASPATPTPQQREAQPGPPRGVTPGTPPATAQPSPSAAPQQPDSTAARPAATPDQQRAINDTIERQIERRAMSPDRDIGVSVSVGTALPERIRIQSLPREIVDVRPQFRDHGIVVTDRETMIVDPRTRRVVEVIARRSGGSRGSESILVERIERGDVREWRDPRVDIREDVILPAEAPLVDLPGDYVERMPRYRGYRYLSSGDEIAIVEPRSRRIVEVINRTPAKTAASPMTTASTGASPMTRDEREEINRMLLQRAGPGTLHGMRELRGSILPSSLELARLPAAVAEKSPALRGMSYVLIGDDVLIVDPESRRVIDVIE